MGLFSAFAGIVQTLRRDPWSWPGMTYCGHCATFSGCKLFIRQKNIRTKDSLNARMFVQAGLTNILTFNVVHLRCWEYYSTFVEKNKRSGCLLLFCSYVLITCLHPACGDMRSLVLARDDGLRAVCKMASCKVKCEAGFTR